MKASVGSVLSLALLIAACEERLSIAEGCEKICSKLESIPTQEGSTRDGHHCAGTSCVETCKAEAKATISDSKDCQGPVEDALNHCRSQLEDECIHTLVNGNSGSANFGSCFRSGVSDSCWAEEEAPPPPDDSNSGSGGSSSAGSSSSSGGNTSTAGSSSDPQAGHCPGVDTCVYDVKTVIEEDGDLRRVYFCSDNLSSDECSMVGGDFVESTTCPARGYGVYCSTDTFFETEEDCVDDGAFGVRQFQPPAELADCVWTAPPTAGTGGMGGTGTAGTSGAGGTSSAGCDQLVDGIYATDLLPQPSFSGETQSLIVVTGGVPVQWCNYMFGSSFEDCTSASIIDLQSTCDGSVKALGETRGIINPPDCVGVDTFEDLDYTWKVVGGNLELEGRQLFKRGAASAKALAACQL